MPAVPGAGWRLAGRGPPSVCGHCTGEPLEAERSAIGLQMVCVLYFGDGWIGNKGRPVIGEGKPGDWGDVRFIVFGGFRGLPPAANGRLRTSVFICGCNSPALAVGSRHRDHWSRLYTLCLVPYGPWLIPSLPLCVLCGSAVNLLPSARPSYDLVRACLVRICPSPGGWSTLLLKLRSSTWTACRCLPRTNGNGRRRR